MFRKNFAFTWCDLLGLALTGSAGIPAGILAHETPINREQAHERHESERCHALAAPKPGDGGPTLPRRPPPTVDSGLHKIDCEDDFGLRTEDCGLPTFPPGTR